jgi:small conductance mechanosensitive channel
MKGDVQTIELFSTTLVHPDRSRIIIPNRKIVGEILHNFGTVRQIHLTVTVPHGSDLGQVLSMIRDVVVANARVLPEPAPVIGVGQIEVAGIRIGLHPWVRVPDVVVAEGEVYRAVVERLGAAGIPAPIPRHDVKLLDSGGLKQSS